MTTEDLLASIDSRLHRIASRYASADIPADDMYQNVVLGLLEQAQLDPTFPEQKPSYILQKAGYIALGKLRSERCFKKHAKGIDARRDILPKFVHPDLVPSATQSPEKQAENLQTAFAILDAMRDMTETDRAIVKMAYRGSSLAEISQALGVSKSAIVQRQNNIANTARRVL